MRKDLHEQNRLSWNAATVAHNSHKGDQAGFLRGGGSPLFPEELDLLGDIAGASLLHLQCNSGQDTLDLARRGAVVTGVDISDAAIAFARQLSAASGIGGSFHRADVYDFLDAARREGRQYDRVFSSYGTISWLSDLDAWASGIAAVLRPSGRLVLVDFHPFAMVFGEDYGFRFDYFDGEPLRTEGGVPDYVAASAHGLNAGGGEDGGGIENFVNPHPAFEFTRGLGLIATTIARAGLRLERVAEYAYANGWKPFPDMVDLGQRRWGLPVGMARFPLMYGLVASA